MTTVRQRDEKWQVQIRRSGARGVSKSFLRRRDAEIWARQMEIQADRSELLIDSSSLKTIIPW